MTINVTQSLRKVYRKTKRALAGAPFAGPAKPILKSLDRLQERELSDAELKAFMRHDAHRIEKAFYNNIFDKKLDYFSKRRDNILKAYNTLVSRTADLNEPTVKWARMIADDFERLAATYISANSYLPDEVDHALASEFVEKVKRSRSVRVWAKSQPSPDELLQFARTMVEAAIWAPCSGDRQPWKFKIIAEQEDKDLLIGLKEEHCYRAPCLIFVGMDSRFYGALGHNEAGLYCDAAAAIAQMKLCAHFANYGACWNHMCRDLLESREQNITIYNNFTEKMGIPNHIEPVAILAFGRAAFIPPTPVRQDLAAVLI